MSKSLQPLRSRRDYGEKAKTAGIMRDPGRITKEMRQRGIELGQGGEVYFYPLTPLGRPNYSSRPFKVRDIEAAVRQTAHVRDGNEDKIESNKKLLDRLSRLGKFLRVADPADPESIETVTDIYDMDVAPLAPSKRVRSKLMVGLRDLLGSISDAVTNGHFGTASNLIGNAYNLIENLMTSWAKQNETWKERRGLLMAIRNMLKKFPEIGPQIMTASVKTAKSKKLRARAEDNHGNEFEASLEDGRDGPVVVLEATGKTAGKWRWYLSSLLGKGPSRRVDDKLYLDFGQGWYVTGMADIIKEAEKGVVMRVASRPKIGPGVELQGKRGIYKVTMGPSELRAGPHGYNRMMESGYTHWCRLESPRGKEFEFYWRPDEAGMLYWYKSHRTMVPMRFKSVKLPPDIKELARKMPSPRSTGQLWVAISDMMGELLESGLPQAEKAAEELQSALDDLSSASGSLQRAKNMMASRTAAKWETKPKGWTDESRKKFWNSLTSRAPKHKVTQCMKKMEGKVSDPGAFCASLADRVDPGWRSRD